MPNGLRVLVKSLYRWPLMVGLPHHFKENVLPKEATTRYEAAHRISAGIVIAVVESFIICPFERVKVYLMTKHERDSSISRFFKSTTMKDLLLGLHA